MIICKTKTETSKNFYVEWLYSKRIEKADLDPFQMMYSEKRNNMSLNPETSTVALCSLLKASLLIHFSASKFASVTECI